MASEAPQLLASLDRLETEARQEVVHTGRYRCRYYDWGSGPTILFIHGLSAHANCFAGVMAELHTEYRCIAYQLPEGRGDQAPLGAMTHADLVADLFALMDHLQLEQSVVLGASFGSTLALAALAEQPQRFQAGILQGAFAHRPLHRFERMLCQVTRYVPGEMRHLPLYRRAQAAVDREVFAEHPEALWDWFARSVSITRTRAVARRALILDSLDLRPRLGAIEQPVLMIGAPDDKVIPLPLEQTVLAGLPNAQRVELTGCGHYPQYLKPQEMAASMRQFLRQVGIS